MNETIPNFVTLRHINWINEKRDFMSYKVLLYIDGAAVSERNFISKARAEGRAKAFSERHSAVISRTQGTDYKPLRK